MDWSLSMVLLFLPIIYCQEMFKDPGFETLTEWSCHLTQCDPVTDKVEGKFALKVSNRTHYYQGPSQTVDSIVPNGQYEASVYVKLLNDEPGVLGQHASLTVEFSLPGDKKDRLYVPAADKPMVTSSDGWIHLQGDFSAPDTPLRSTRLYVSGPHPTVNFLVDSASLKVAPTAPQNWKADTDDVIGRIRKSNITIKITWDPSVDPIDLEIQLKQVKHGFPFGTAVRAQQYLHGDRRYSDFINKHFNHAVLENDLKWPENARYAGAAHYETAVEALNKLRLNGHRANAHCLLWSKVDKVPPWVRPLRGNALRHAVTHRISEALNKTKGLVEHWDVNNENLHTQWFREALQDRDYNMEVFRIANQVDPNVKLFFNENTVTARGGDTMAYRDMAMQFKQAGVPVHGMGVQTHFRDLTAPDPYLLKKRLDLLAQVGLPLWVSELDLYSPDVNKRADWYETALRSLFGHPAVESIMLWGFWSEQQWRGEPASLVSGSNFQINAAGQRFLDLLEKEWMTNVTSKISHDHRQIEVRGFHGDYELTATYQGRPVQTKTTFTLGKTDTHAKLHIPKLSATIIG